MKRCCTCFAVQHSAKIRCLLIFPSVQLYNVWFLNLFDQRIGKVTVAFCLLNCIISLALNNCYPHMQLLSPGVFCVLSATIMDGSATHASNLTRGKCRTTCIVALTIKALYLHLQELFSRPIHRFSYRLAVCANEISTTVESSIVDWCGIDRRPLGPSRASIKNHHRTSGLNSDSSDSPLCLSLKRNVNRQEPTSEVVSLQISEHFEPG